jgi:hypothetical protein
VYLQALLTPEPILGGSYKDDTETKLSGECARTKKRTRRTYTTAGVALVFGTDLLDAGGAGVGDGRSVAEVAAGRQAEKGLVGYRSRTINRDDKGLRVDTGQNLSVDGLDVFEDNITPGGRGTNGLGLAVSARSVELAKVLSDAIQGEVVSSTAARED